MGITGCSGITKKLTIDSLGNVFCDTDQSGAGDFNYNETFTGMLVYNQTYVRSDIINSTYVTKNASHIINSQISCLNITGTGGDSDFCNDATATGGSFSNAVSNLTGLTSSDGRINFSGSADPRNNVSITLRLSDNVPFNVTFANYDKYNFNQTLTIFDC